MNTQQQRLPSNGSLIKGKRKKTIASDETKELKKKERRETFILPQQRITGLVAGDAAGGTFDIGGAESRL